jgi:hypothetical protein
MRRRIRKHGERAGRIVPETSDEHESDWTAIDRHSAAPRRVKCTPTRAGHLCGQRINHQRDARGLTARQDSRRQGLALLISAIVADVSLAYFREFLARESLRQATGSTN